MTPPRLALGTAQLGLHYGVANAGGRPTAPECERILDAALALGMEYLDTARAYGEAESRIGRWLRRRARPETLRVGTKLSRLAGGLTIPELEREVAAAVDRSRITLGVERLDDLLLHSPENLREYGPDLVAILTVHRDAGRVGRIGMSVYDVEEGVLAAAYPALSVTQVPFNIFDRRFVSARVVDRLRSAGHEVFARSVLAQGLVALSPASAEAAVPGSGGWVDRFQQICSVHAARPVAAALGFALARSGADQVVVGVESVQQLQEVVAVFHRPAPIPLLDDLQGEFAAVPEALRDPRRWPGAA